MPDGEQRNLRHIYLAGHGHREPFTWPTGGGGSVAIPSRNRAQHAARLEQALTEAIAAADQQIAARNPEIAGGSPGFYLEFDIGSEQREILDRLEDKRGHDHIELVAVRPAEADPENKLSATVFVPEAKRELYLKKVEDYRTGDTPTGKPKNQSLVASLDEVRLAQARSLFTDDPGSFPDAGQQAWWEVWLRTDARPVLEHAANGLGMVLRDHIVRFPEREVVLALAKPNQIGSVVANTDVVAELRLARDTPAMFLEMDAREQREWNDELAERVQLPNDDAPSVCILDSGTTRPHPLIEPVLDAADQQSWNAVWPVEDTSGNWLGHGTGMSGLALYGDLVDPLAGNDPVVLGHVLESVKILPDQGANDPDLYGYITAEAMSRAEIQAPERARVFCLAVTAEGDHWAGRPSSWSAALDELAYGDGQDQRLATVSAGNISALYPASEYLHQNDASPIESPAQAWNVLTVGAVTEKCTITDPTFVGWAPLAPAGDLSPLSRTSITWQHEWPIKPDIVLEGGNYGVNPANDDSDHLDDLALLTTNNLLQNGYFNVISDTSAATALASRMAAQILADRQELWPETVRGLVVHSADWTPAMRGHLPVSPSQSHKRLLLRRYGYGVPDPDRTIRSRNNDVTLVIENSMQPFYLDGSTIKTRDMIFHDLPWPAETLEALGEEQVQLRVTLSYFIEPNPGERGWTKRHRYASHGLRFAVKRPEEDVATFRGRINAAAREEEEGGYTGGQEEGWVLGPRLRNRGSLHSDVWEGTATDLANRHGIAVYPTGGWWREKRSLERYDRETRYALLLTLRAQTTVDLYTEIANAVGVEVEIETA
ncbi:MAG: S8 family peptidase [Hyphomicrobiales bacterium]|nr:S8 family peptidase [Hyphomicrobiales bacterium]